MTSDQKKSWRTFAMATGFILFGTLFPKAQAMQILNAKSGDAIDYPLAFFYGSTSTSASDVTLNGISWPIRQNHFKVLAKLKPGPNDLIFDFGSAQEHFSIRYQPKTNSRYMRLVYFIGSDQDGRFEAPAGMPNATADAAARIKLAGLLMQTFYAETGKRTIETVNHASGVPKRTLRLELDSNDEPIVHVVRSTKHTAAEWRAVPSDTGYGVVHRNVPGRHETQPALSLV